MEENQTLNVADHIYIDCQGYSHHGIYVGDERVIHFESTPTRKFLGRATGDVPVICEVSLAEFATDKIIHVRSYEESVLSPEVSIQYAQSRLGEKGYCLFDNNCEHFAVWCKTGQSQSSQVESAQRVAGTGMAGVAMGSAIVRSARFLPLPYRVFAYTAGAAVAIGSTTYRLVLEKKRNRQSGLS